MSGMSWCERVGRTALTEHGECVHITLSRAEPYLALCGVYVLLGHQQHEKAKALWLRGRAGIAGENFRCSRCCRIAERRGGENGGEA